MNKPTQNPESLVWSLADLLRGSWKQHEYQDVILPLLLLKRIDTMLEPTRSEVRRNTTSSTARQTLHQSSAPPPRWIFTILLSSTLTHCSTSHRT